MQQGIYQRANQIGKMPANDLETDRGVPVVADVRVARRPPCRPRAKPLLSYPRPKRDDPVLRLLRGAGYEPSMLVFNYRNVINSDL